MKSLQSLGLGVVALGLMSATPALALSPLQWNYTADGFYDGVTNGVVGNHANPGYEFFGLAYAEDDANFYFALNSNVQQGGNLVGSKMVGLGDLFLNFSGSDFNTAMANNQLFAVHFASNDVNLEYGLYGGVKAKSIALNNYGFSSMNEYNNYVGNGASWGGLDIHGNYVNKGGAILNVIDTYQSKLSSIVSIDNFTGSGLNFAGNVGQTGTYTYGFSVSKTGLPTGNFVGLLYAECGNDSMGFRGELTQKTPESSNTLGLMVLGILGLLGWKSRREN